MDFVSLISDIFVLASGLLFRLWQDGLSNFSIALATGILLAGVVGWLTKQLALGFNRQFDLRPQHKFYSAIAALITLVFTLLFFSLRYAEDLAEFQVLTWGQVIQADKDWGAETYRSAYESVYDLRKPNGQPLEDFSRFPHPDKGKTKIPLTNDRSIELVAKTYVQAAEDHFRTNHPVLSHILWATSSNAKSSIYDDIKHEFNVKGTKTYPVSMTIRLAEKQIQKRLKEQLPHIVIVSRVALVILFLIIQLITIGLLIRAALADIKVKKYSSLKTTSSDR